MTSFMKGPIPRKRLIVQLHSVAIYGMTRFPLLHNLLHQIAFKFVAMPKPCQFVPFLCKNFPLKMSFVFAGSRNFHLLLFYCKVHAHLISHIFCVSLHRNHPNCLILIIQNLRLTIPKFCEKGFTYPQKSDYLSLNTK